jgi:hypothetical protein
MIQRVPLCLVLTTLAADLQQDLLQWSRSRSRGSFQPVVELWNGGWTLCSRAQASFCS